jgi:perosamine synthetase
MPDLTGNEEKYVVEAIRSSWISSAGPFIQRFEEEFAAACETEASLALANGTVALHLAMLALNVGPGDEVIVPSLTYIATANAVRYVGAEPVFVDVDLNTWCMDPKLIENAITVRTKGIIPVHIYGHPADMDAINKIAAIHGLWVVEDAAEAHFARYKGRVVGGLAKMATFSFFGNKILTSGEGGAIAINDKQLELRMRTLRGQGVDPERRYYFPVTGYNFRITNLACAILCAQLERRDQIIESRVHIFNEYKKNLLNIAGIGFQPVADWAEPARWLFCITVDKNEYGRTRDELMAILHENGVDSRPFFLPLHKLPPFREQSRLRGEDFPITDKLSQEGMNLPTYNSLKFSDIQMICNLIKHNKA